MVDDNQAQGSSAAAAMDSSSSSSRPPMPMFGQDDDEDDDPFPSSSSPPDALSSSGSGSGRSQKGRGRLRIHNVGGSLTFLLQIALLAWGVRQLRGVLRRRRQRKSEDTGGGHVNNMPCQAVDPPLFAHLSPVAVQKLVELDPTPYLLIDVRHQEALCTEAKLLENAINIPEPEVRYCLQLSESDWKTRFPTLKKPGLEDMLVFLSTRGKRAERVAASAVDLGYKGCCVLKGGFQALQTTSSSGNAEGLQYLSRDAVALLLQRKEALVSVKAAGTNVPYLIDVRRHDERELYGHIKGSLHIQVEEWPKALAMDSLAWEEHFHTPKLGSDDLVILQCRTSRRASWAAHLAQDAGLKRCFVYKQGAFGWRLDPLVLPYDSYELGDVPPKPFNFEVEKVDCEAAKIELHQLGLL